MLDISFGLFGTEKLPSEYADGVNRIPIQGAVLDTLWLKTRLQSTLQILACAVLGQVERSPRVGVHEKIHEKLHEKLHEKTEKLHTIL